MFIYHTPWCTNVNSNFISHFLPLPTHHTHFPFFFNNGYVLRHKWPMVRWRTSWLCSGMNLLIVILRKVAQLLYYLLSEMSERIFSCAPQPWLIRKLCLVFPEQSKTIYHFYVNKMKEGFFHHLTHFLRTLWVPKIQSDLSTAFIKQL